MQTNITTLPYHVHKPEGLRDIEAAGVIVLIYNGNSHYGGITARPGIAFANFCTLREVPIQCTPLADAEEKWDGDSTPSHAMETDALLPAP